MDDGLNEIPIERYATRTNRKDRHHIFSAALMAANEQPPKDYNSIANVALLTAQENQRIGKKQPRYYLESARTNERTFRLKMERHLIPIGADTECGTTSSSRVPSVPEAAYSLALSGVGGRGGHDAVPRQRAGVAPIAPVGALPVVRGR